MDSNSMQRVTHSLALLQLGHALALAMPDPARWIADVFDAAGKAVTRDTSPGDRRVALLRTIDQASAAAAADETSARALRAAACVLLESTAPVGVARVF